MKSGLTIKRLLFGGLDAIELQTSALRLVALTGRGPRVAFFGLPGDDNLLYWAPGKHRRGSWDLHGGHRLWPTRPGADEAEETYAADNEPCEVETHARSFTLTAAVDPVHRTRRGIKVTLLEAGCVAVDHFIRNESEMLWSGGLWGLTCTAPGKESRYFIPLGDGSAWDSATVVSFRTWGGGHGGVGFEDPQFQFTQDAMVIHPAGRENKRMVRADAGIIALHDPARQLVFAKQAEFVPMGTYPLGTNLAVYVGPENFMVEMETMGPVATLKPGQVLTHRETWVLAAAKAAPTTATLRTLFG